MSVLKLDISKKNLNMLFDENQAETFLLIPLTDIN